MTMDILRRLRIRLTLAGAFGAKIGVVLLPILSTVPGIADDYQANRIRIEYMPRKMRPPPRIRSRKAAACAGKASEAL